MVFLLFYFISAFHFLDFLKVTLSFLSYVFKPLIQNSCLPVIGFSELVEFSLCFVFLFFNSSLVLLLPLHFIYFCCVVFFFLRNELGKSIWSYCFTEFRWLLLKTATEILNLCYQIFSGTNISKEWNLFSNM